ncbi:MAG TPA: glycosyltransferase family 4 protein [Gemmatimonadales bacterium]|nr:glycosyltransferase family 4 protein [Gemmatimonadales bacterium]
MAKFPAPAARLGVLHVLTPTPGGGVEPVVSALTLGFRGSPVRCRVAVVIPAGHHPPCFLAPLRNGGIEVYTIEVPRRGYLRERAAIEQLCRRLRPDVVHTHGYRADVVDGPAARRLGIPVITTAHGFTGGGPKNRVYQWLQRRAWRRFDAVVAVSRPLMAQLARWVPSERLHCVPNAWYPAEPPLEPAAARRALGVGPDELRVAWVGRLSAEKGPDVLIEALARLRDIPVTVSFLGAGPLREALEAQAARLRVADRIRWHGLVPGAARLLPAFAALALTSRTEGTPIVLLEAMAAGVPIVATAVGGVPDVVSEREAVLVPPDDPEAVATALREVLAAGSRTHRRVEAARARLERDFPLAAWLERYERVYRAVRRERSSTRKEARGCAVLP